MSEDGWPCLLHFRHIFDGKTDHLAKENSVNGLLHQSAQIHHVVGHRCSFQSGVGADNQTLPDSADDHRAAQLHLVLVRHHP